MTENDHAAFPRNSAAKATLELAVYVQMSRTQWHHGDKNKNNNKQKLHGNICIFPTAFYRNVVEMFISFMFAAKPKNSKLKLEHFRTFQGSKCVASHTATGQ